MKVRWRDSYLSTENLDEDKKFLKNEEELLNEVLKFEGFIFLNDVLKSLGFDRIKRGQLDGWIFDELDSEKKHVVKLKLKEENGELILNLNEEKDITDYVFKED